MSSSVLPGADASRGGILTPTSDGALNRNDGTLLSCDTPKRKHADTAAMDHLLKPQIALKAHPPNLHVQPRFLQPLMLLPREHLPLSYLDLAAPHGDLPSSQLYESHIKILDLESRMGAATKVLIARYETRGTIYALERHDNGLYVACKLAASADPESLANHATVLCQERIQPTPTKPAESNTTGAMATPQTHKDQKKKRVAIEAIQSLVRKRARSQSVSTFEDATRPGTAVDSPQDGPASLPSSDLKPEKLSEAVEPVKEQIPAVKIVAGPESAQQQTAENIFENIRTHYFEALYRSKGSLAYFAKGPMSRARSAFHLDLESDLDINDLIEFLKGLVLTTVQVDKKYRETIPDLVSKIKPLVDSSDEGPRKKRRSKKMKLGKDGLYPHEDESVQQWWAANKPELGDDDEDGITMSQIKEHASLLRTRETQLQMIVILEILALEPLKAPEQATDSLPTLPGASDTLEQMAPPPPPKKRNKHNLPMLIDVHTDRLTIWQSMASHEHILLQDSQVPTPNANSQAQQQKASSEPLRDFCVDVIVPFYSSRLPQLCDSLSRKLGGPVIVSPPKHKSKSRSLKRTSSKSDQKPGAAARRTALQKEPRTLERALSFEQQHRRSMSRGPSQLDHLMRATSASISSVKREDSDLANPRVVGKSDSKHERHGSLSRTSSSAGLDDNKANKKAKIEAELRDAISNLRKPNREVVGQAMAEAAERKATAATSAKKPRKVTKPVTNSGIQVKATPMNQRFKDVMAPKFEEVMDVPLPSTEDIIPPSSAGPMVPSTTSRNSFKNMLQNSASPAMDVIGHTPMKQSSGPSFLRRPTTLDEPAIPPSSPLKGRQPAPMDSPMVPGSAVKLNRGRFADIPVTPIKKSAPRSVGVEQGKQTSIYDRLGWDDDELDDLL